MAMEVALSGEGMRQFSFPFRHEDAVCMLLARRIVKRTLHLTFDASNKTEARVLAENHRYAGVCGHVYKLASITRK
jgi:hypothetical protein